MSLLNTTVCVTGGANTGVSDCPLDFKLAQFIIKVPQSFELTAANMATKETVMTALKAAISADLASARIFPYPQQVAFTDNSTDPAFQAFSSGTSVPANDGIYNWMFQFTKGALCLSNQLRKFNNDSNSYFLVVDANGNLYGTTSGVSAKGNLKGIPANFIYTDKFKMATYTEVSLYAYRVDFFPNYLNEDVAWIGLNLGELRALSGLKNIGLDQVGVRSAAVFKFKAYAGCNKTDLYAQYSTQIAALSSGDIDVRRDVNGIATKVDVVSIVVDANIAGWTVTLDTTDPDYSATGPLTLTLPAVSKLVTAGVIGYESLSTTIVTA